MRRPNVLPVIAGLAMLVCLLLPGKAANARDDAGAAALEEIVVVAHRLPRARRDVAANVTVLSGADARLELAQTLPELLRYVPGIDFESAGTRFGAESINIRGISGNRVAIRLDGVPVADHFTVGSFSNATRNLAHSGFVRQVEVLHGPASAMYGSDAIGGVVSMQTYTAQDMGGNGGLFASNYGGATNSTSVTAMQAVTGGNLSIAAGIAYHDGEEAEAAAARGSLDRVDAESRAGFADLSYEDEIGGTWHARYFRRDSEAESSLESMLGAGRFRSTTALRGNDEQLAEIVSLEYASQQFPGLDGAVIRAYQQSSVTEQQTYDERGNAARPVAIDRLFEFEQESRGVEASFLRSVAFGNVNHDIGFGVDFRRREADEFRDGIESGLDDGATTRIILGEEFPLRDFPVSVTREWGAYAEDSIGFDNWSVIAAVRWDRYEMQPEIDAIYVADYPFAEPVSITSSEISPKLGIIARLSESSEGYLQYAHGFRAPPYEAANFSLDIPRFNIRAVPNPDLRAERSDSIEGGFRWRSDRASAYISVFHTQYEDFIEPRVNIGIDPVSGRVLFQSQNIDKAAITGIEAGGSAELDDWVSGLAVDALLFAARGRNHQNDEPLNSVGPPQLVLGASLAQPGSRWHLRMQAVFTASWSERDQTNGELYEPAGHAVFDAYLAFRASPNVMLRAGVRNLTDTTYWSWTDIGGLQPDDPTIPYLSQPGRSFSAGFDIEW